jgi:hypothetical protein
MRRVTSPAIEIASMANRPIALQSPSQNGHTERVIGAIRRECLDHVVIFGERCLHHLLLLYGDRMERGPTCRCMKMRRFRAPFRPLDTSLRHQFSV